MDRSQRRRVLASSLEHGTSQCKNPLMRIIVAGAYLLVAVGGCAPFHNDTTVCSQYREVRCATAPECSYDRARGCRVCRCSRSGSGWLAPAPLSDAPNQLPAK